MRGCIDFLQFFCNPLTIKDWEEVQTVLDASFLKISHYREFGLGVDILQVFHKLWIRFGERLWRVDVFFLVFRFAGLCIERNSGTRCLKLQMKRIQVEHFAGWTGFWTSFVVQSRVVILLVVSRTYEVCTTSAENRSESLFHVIRLKIGVSALPHPSSS